MRDFIVAVRELDPSRFNEAQQSWINKHTVYTHGNGFIAAPANTVDAPPTDAESQSGGLPKFYVSDLETIREPGYDREPIQVRQPRIYFGELISNVDPDYAIVGSANGEDHEFDQEGVQYTYTADSGVPLSNFGTRLLYAIKYGERNFLLSDAINDNSRILYDRDPRDRVSKVAPWLTTDSKTYPAVMADGSIKWIVDGYTTLKNYPYAQRMALDAATTDSRAQDAGQTGRVQAPDEVSYARNSVKATVDAYTGEVTLYQFDEHDPVLKTWMKAFPGTVKPRAELDKHPDLLAHMRYPEDLFKLQRELLTKYHVTNPSDFYQANNFWSVPADPTADQNTLSQPPYYFTAANPDGKGTPSFQLTSVTTPLRRTNLAAYITSASDPENYGKITVMTTPTSGRDQIEGPGQVFEALKGAVAQQITLVQGTVNVTYGNLLTLPVGENGVLYVQPVYTQSKDSTTAMPKVFRMLTYYKTPDGRVETGAAPTIGEALRQVGIDPRVATEPEAERPDGETGADDGSGDDTGTPAPRPTPSGPNAPDPAAVEALRRAVENMEKAEKSGDLAKIGEALTELQAALRQYPGN